MAEGKPQASPTDSMDTEVSRLVVDQKLATREEVERAQQICSGDPNESLANALVREGYVTETQISRLKKNIEESRAQQIPGYQVLSKIGAGAMATVFKGKQLSLDRVVAIKVLPPRLSKNPEYVELFYKEGQAAAKLNHPNIVQAIDVGESHGYHYFVMEYVEGHTVYDEISRGKVFSESEALRMITQVARALEHAHDRGLIHRDVKPKNIMITPERVAKLADMGLARLTADKEAAEAEAGRAFGTPYYISPEQIRGAKDIDFRTDIYSLGATLYHMLTGRVPFEGQTPVDVMQKHLKEPLTPPDHLNTTLSAGVGEVVEVMMAKERRHRYSSTKDLISDLEAIASGDAPLIARRGLDADVLSGLGESAEAGELEPQEAPEPAGSSPPNALTYLIIIGAALAVSVLLNIVLLVRG